MNKLSVKPAILKEEIQMLTEHDSELLSKNKTHYCNNYSIYFSLSRGWELYNILNDCVMRGINYCPFCGEKLG